MSESLDDFETEGVRAFLALTTAVNGLGSRLTGFEEGLGRDVAAASLAASTAQISASAAKEAAEALKTAAAELGEAAKSRAASLSAWTILAVAAAVLTAGAAGYRLGHSAGWDAGNAAGYAAAKDEKAAASWANTTAGVLARALDEAGSLGVLARCDRPGWKAEKREGHRLCIPYAAKDQTVWGWVIP
jgi:hypothetical protein